MYSFPLKNRCHNTDTEKKENLRRKHKTKYDFMLISGSIHNENMS